MLPLNPYVAGNPVGDSPAFIGRADVLREVARILRRSQDNAIVLYGQRRIGKTSILQHLAAQLPGEGPYRPVYFDLQDKADWPLGRVLQNLAREVAHALGQPDPDLGDAPATTFRQKWLPTVLDDLPEGCSLVLLFDEFDVLADPKGEQAGAAFFPYLRNLLASDPERMQFVFVIGRNVDDLDTIALSLFKGTPYRRVSLLNREDTADLVRLSEGNGTLRWPDDTVEQVWQLTNGHPFLTQQLCSHVWERAYDEGLEDPPTVTPADVNAAVPDALEVSRNTLEWLWGGLPPAERVVISALAEAGPGPITQEKLERLLHESGVRVVIRELQNAPEMLQDWDLIEPADDGYRFRVELLRQWIVEHKPLRRVQEELDRIEPVAENLYGAASGLYRGGQLDQAVPLLRQAIALNPNHVRANQLLADILLAQGQANEARQLLERLYEYQPAAARSRLVQALLAQAKAAEDDDERLALYGQVLNLNPRQPEATAGKQRIWKKRGDAAWEGDDLETALEAYREANLPNKVDDVESEMRRRALAPHLQELEVLGQKEQYREALGLAHKLASEYPGVIDWTSRVSEIEQESHRHAMTIRLKELETLEEEGQYQDALKLAHELASEYPEMRDWDETERGIRDRELATRLQEIETLKQKKNYEDALELVRELASAYPDVRDWEADVERLEREAELTALYQRALGALQSGNREIAQDLLVKVINLEPGYEEATRYLHLAVTGEDMAEREEAEKKPARRLSPWNPLDYLRLLWWVLVAPGQLETYRKMFGEKDEGRMVKWLVSTLIWLPILFPVLALGMGSLPRARYSFSSTTYLWVSFGLALTWALTGRLKVAGKVGVTVPIVVGVMVSAVGVVALSLMGDIEVIGKIGVIRINEVGSVTLGMASGAALGVALGMAGSTTLGVALGVVGIVAGILAVGSELIGGTVLDMAVVVAGVVALVVAIAVMSSIKNSLETGRPSWLARMAFASLVLAYTFLLCVCFLGGWQVFQ